MSVAYVDTSCLVALALGEVAAEETARRLESFDLLSSNLLESELRAALAREAAPAAPDLLSWVSWVLPDRPLSDEIGTVLDAGYLRGADLWHLACALYLSATPLEVTFLTLDDRQKEIARQLGFAI